MERLKSHCWVLFLLDGNRPPKMYDFIDVFIFFILLGELLGM